MATTTATAISAANTDDVYGSRSNQPGVGNNPAQYDTGYLDIADHPSTTWAPVTGCVFTIPALPGWSGNVSDITDCYIEYYNGAGTATVSIKSQVKLISGTPSGGTFPSSYTSGNTPLSMYDNAVTVSPVGWDTGGGYAGSWTLNTYKRGPSVTDHLKNAITAGATPGTSKVTVVVYGVTSAGPNNGARVNSYNAGSNRPTLKVEYNYTPQSGTATPARVTGSGATRTARASRLLAYMTSPVQGKALLTKPPTAPPTGNPVVVFVHGGRFVSGFCDTVSRTDENGIPFDWQEALIDAGWAVASAEYVLSLETPFYNEVWTHPYGVKQVKTLVRYLQTNAASLGLDATKIVLAGMSAGGQIAAMAALTIGDTATYTLVQNGAPNGRCGFGKTSNYAQEVQVNFRPFGSYGGTSLTRMVTDGTEPDSIAGLMLYAAPIDMTGLQGYNSPFNQSAYNAYHGLSTGETPGTSLKSESDVDDYMLGTTGTIYAGRTRTPDIPVLYVRAGADTSFIPNAVGVTPLVNALTTLGVDTSKAEVTSGTNPDATAMSRTGLTRMVVTGADHAHTIFSSDPADTVTWLNMATSAPAWTPTVAVF